MFADVRRLLPIVLAAGCVAASAEEPKEADAKAGGAAAAQQLWAAQCEDWDEWDKPGPPFRVFGNTWYVGTCGISALLVTGEDGHVLIDGGPEPAAQAIAGNIETLGFKLADVKLLLSSHEHHDHVGGLARLQQLSGAAYRSSPLAAAAMGTGRVSPDDPQYGALEDFPPVEIDGLVVNGKPERVGSLSLVPLTTPGHTAGALSWQWESCQDGECLSIVYADSLSPVSAEGYRFSDHPALVDLYRNGLKRLAALDCDLLLTPHPSASDMRTRVSGGAPLVDARGCTNYAAAIEKRLDQRLAQETDGG